MTMVQRSHKKALLNTVNHDDVGVWNVLAVSKEWPLN